MDTSAGESQYMSLGLSVNPYFSLRPPPTPSFFPVMDRLPSSNLQEAALHSEIVKQVIASKYATRDLGDGIINVLKLAEDKWLEGELGAAPEELCSWMPVPASILTQDPYYQIRTTDN